MCIFDPGGDGVEFGSVPADVNGFRRIPRNGIPFHKVPQFHLGGTIVMLVVIISCSKLEAGLKQQVEKLLQPLTATTMYIVKQCMSYSDGDNSRLKAMLDAVAAAGKVSNKYQFIHKFRKKTIMLLSAVKDKVK